VHAVTAESHVVKDVTVGPLPASTPPGALLGAWPRLFAPAYRPACLVMLETCWPAPTEAPEGLQFIDDRTGTLHAVNLPAWKAPAGTPPARRRTLVSALPSGIERGRLRLLYTDGGDRHFPIAELEGDGSLWRLSGPGPAPLARPTRPSLFFVGGAPKSGTTYVEQILNAHPSVLCTGEGGFFSALDRASLEGCLARRELCDFNPWTTPRPDRRFELDFMLGALARAFFELHASLFPCSAVGDRTPANSRFVANLLAAVPEARFIHCARHPLDVAVSRLYHEWNLFRAGKLALCALSEEHLVRLDRAIASPDAAAAVSTALEDPALLEALLAEWIEINRVVLEAHGRLEDRIALVRYEDLLARTETEVARLFAFLSIPTSARQVAAIAEATRFERVSGGRAAGSEDARSFFRKGIAGDHLSYFPEGRRAAARTLLGDLASRLGYEL
jgi:hypothetical protein